MAKASDVTAPARHVTLDGTTYELLFNNRAARIAEDIYECQYGRDVGYMEILTELASYKHRAILALVYGALIAGGADMPWDSFENAFTYDALEGVREAVQGALMASLPQPEGDAKNPPATPTGKARATRGRG